MVFRKTQSLLALVLILAFSAHAEAKRYLVTFKSQAAYQASAIRSFDSAGPVKLFNTQAFVTKALHNVEILVIESEDANAIAQLRKNPKVAFVEEEVMYPAPPRISRSGFSPDASLAPSVPFEMPWGINAVHAPQAWAVTRGQGARVMVLDTGLDTTHVALLSRFEKGRNFSGGSSSDISDDVGHGTHVAGTVLADGLNGGLHGVAPDAKLLMGKVCTTAGCSSIGIAQGLDWAVSERVDVVNMSLGGSFMSSAERQAMDRAEAAGVTVVAASGNSGTNSVSFPAAYHSALAVGAIDSTSVKADFSQFGPELDLVAPGVEVMSSVPVGSGRGGTAELDVDGKGLAQVKAVPFVGAPLFSRAVKEVVFAGLGKPADFQGKNFSGKYALISRGEITFKEKVEAAIAAGAAGVIVFNNAPGLIQGGLTEDGSEVAIPATMIEQVAGEAVRDALNSGRVLNAAMSIDRTDYAEFQGTSMASPHVAGVAALVKSANPRLTPAQVREVLKTTATPLGPNTNNEYGAGLVNAEAAVNRARTM